jgi:Fe-S-cluster containining protein
MSVLVVGLLSVFLFYMLFLLGCFAVVKLLPASFLGEPAKAVLTWLPPFIGGEALRNWAARTAEQATQKRLAGQRNGETAAQLAAEVEDAVMQAMLPLASPEERGRVVACPKTGQGTIGVTAPEALAIAAYLQDNMSRAEQQRIHDMAVENARNIASRAQGYLPPIPLLVAVEMNEKTKLASHSPGSRPAPLPCPLQGQDHVCCVYTARPLRCRILHAITVARDTPGPDAPPGESRPEALDDNRHEQTVAAGIEIGVTRALKSAGLDANIYELNSALATALETPDAAERWARGENIFHS